METIASTRAAAAAAAGSTSSEWQGGSYSNETYFFTYSFPIYRALAVLVLYTGILGLNELAFNEHKIVYQRLLGIDFDIKPKRVLRKVLVFMLLFFVGFIWEQLEIDLTLSLSSSDSLNSQPAARITQTTEQSVPSAKEQQTLLNSSQVEILKEYFGAILWLACIAYSLFVGRQTCKWIGKTLFYSVISPFQHAIVAFPLAFTTDQVVSLVGPMKDLSYTFCYYSSEFQKIESLQACKQSASLQYIAYFPLGLRIAQCLRNCYERGDYKGNDMANLGKYLMSVLVVAFSHIASSDHKFFDIWIFFAVLSTLYSFAWDVKKDWSLGDRRCNFLRERLLFRESSYYYAAIATDLLLRCTWVFTLSGGVVSHFDIRHEAFNLLVYLLEVVRRCMWNLLRMENEQISQRAVRTTSFFLPQPSRRSSSAESFRISFVEMTSMNKFTRTSSTKQSLILQSDIY